MNAPLHLPQTLYPLSSVQREIWFDQMLHPEAAIYNIGAYNRIEGGLDPSLFRQAIDLLIQENEILRLRLVIRDGRPLQSFPDLTDAFLEFRDCRTEENPFAAALADMRQTLLRPFRLPADPLFRYTLYQISETGFLWSQIYHHLVIDGYSASLLTHRSAAIYNALLDGQTPPAPAGASYLEFVADETDYLASARFDQHRQYWQKTFAILPEALFSPKPDSLAAAEITPCAVQTFFLPHDCLDRLEALAQSYSATVLHALLGLLAIYFTRVEERDECVIGLPLLNRSTAAFNKSIGPFVSMVPARLACDPGTGFGSLIQSIARNLRRAYRHQRFPISEINRLSGILQNGRKRLFDLSLSYAKHDFGAAFGNCALCETRVIYSDFEQTPLSVVIGDYGAHQDIQIDFSGNLAYFNAAEIGRIAQRFIHLLEEVLVDPECPIGQLDLLLPTEKQLLLVDWNNSMAPASGAFAHQLFEAQAARSHEAMALVFENETLTYRELNARANRLAHHLIELGVEPDAPVAIALERSPDMIAALLAVLKAGGAYVPLDPDYPAERLAFMLEDSGAAILITCNALRRKLPSAERTLCLDADTATLARQPDTNPGRPVAPENLAYVIYTSGSTGKPKGVAVEHAAIAGHCQNIRAAYRLTPVDRVCQFASLSFDTSLEQILPPLATGACVVLPPPGLITVETLDACLHEHAVTVMDLPPAFFRLWASSCLLPLPAGLRLVILGGEALTAETMAARNRWPTPRPRLLNAYGPTEATITATLDAVPDILEPDPVSIGRPLPGRKLYVLDRYLQPVPVGVAGELCIGGTSLARGYLKRPELTAEKFIADPFSGQPGARLYRTGDRVRYRPDGRLEFLGRIDHQVKIRGFRIEPGEIEATLRQHAEVEEAVIVANDDALGAYLVLRNHSLAGESHRYHLLTTAQRPSLGSLMEQEHALSWPAFFAGDRIQSRYWSKLYQTFPDFQFAALDGEAIALAGNMAPLFWDETAAGLPAGWDAALERAFVGHERGTKANTICVLAGVVSRGVQGRNLSYTLIATMARIANRLGFEHLIVPVRPTLKTHHPHIALAEYAALRREEDDQPCDPWLRVHHRLGGRNLGYSEQSQQVEGSIAQWREWTGLDFPASGNYAVAGALQPVRIDLENDHGIYYDQAIWVEHDLSKFIDQLPSLTTPEALCDDLRTRLPAHMLPARWSIIERIPLTPNGKIDRRALPTLTFSAPTPPARPRDALEEIVAGLWGSVLEQAPPGLHDNFFQQGGHSLLAIQLASRVREALGFAVPIRWIFETPTLLSLAARLRQALAGRQPAATPIPANRIVPDTLRITPDLLPLVCLTQSEIDQIVHTVEGGTANIQDIYPLAPLQAGILFHHQQQHTGDSYLLSVLLAFDSAARSQAFIRALQHAIDHHDILRTAVVWERLPEPVQVVWRQAVLPVETKHFDPAAGPIAEQLVEAFHPRHTRIDLTQAPLLRIIRAEDGERSLLFFLSHHLLMDHVSLGVVLEEIGAHLRGGSPTLPPPVPFRNFVAEGRRGVPVEAREAFFRHMLGSIETPTAPFGLLDVQGNGATIVEAYRILPDELALRLRQQSRRLGATPAALCHLAWALVLSRCCNQDDVVFGTVLFGRMQGSEGVERAVGMFINTLPIRITCDARPVNEVLRQTQQDLLALMHHEHASLSLAQRCSAIPAPTPLFSTLLNYRHTPEPVADTLRRDGIELLRAEERANYPLALLVDDFGEGFGLTAQVDASVDPQRICTMMQQALAVLVTALEEAPLAPLCSLDILPAEEKKQLLVDWNATATPLPDSPVHQLFEAQAARTPDAAAVVFEDETLTYADLNARANQLAHRLIALGVQPDDRVAIALERSPGMIVALLAVLKAGGAFVPLDPDYPAERLAFMLEDSGAKILLTQTARYERLLRQAAQVVCLDAEKTSLAQQAQTNLNRPVALHHLAYVIYTSGSTGKPKGVAIEHRGLPNLALTQSAAFGITPQSRVLQFASFSFDAAVFEIFMALGSGATLYLPNGEQRPPGLPLWQHLADHAITHVTLPPSALAVLPQRPLPELKSLIVAGEPCPPALAAFWATDRRFFNGYGPTEVTVCATIAECRDIDPASPLPIGRPIANTRIYVLDRHRQPVPIGIPGELYLGGIGIARGYLNRPELTAERFIRNPFATTVAATEHESSLAPCGRGAEGEGNEANSHLYRTGDLVRYRPDGQLEFLGRIDHQVKIRGFRIELGEIENALTGYPGLREAVVIARPDDNGDLRLIAYLVTSTSSPPSVSDLRAFLQNTLPQHMLPAAFVFLPKLPLTPNGKLDRKALPEPGFNASEHYQAPRDTIEQQLVSLWETVLAVRPIGLNDNFFQQGGHSLLAVRLVNEIKRQFDTSIPVSQVFERPTIAELAPLLREQGKPIPTSCCVRIRASGSRPPLFFLPGIGGMASYLYPLAQALDPDIPFVAFQAQGLDGLSVPHANAKAMAAHYVELVQEIQPQGPYFLGGHSFGAQVAYAMARQLRARGASIGLLALVDAPAPSLVKSDALFQFDENKALLEIGQLFGHLHQHEFILNDDPLAALKPEQQLQAIAQRLEAVDLLPKGTATAYLQSLIGTLKAHLRLPEEDATAYNHENIPMLQFRAEEPMPGQARQENVPEDLGWSRYSNSPVSIQFVPGDHLSMMFSPQVAVLAKELSKSLLKASTELDKSTNHA